MSRIISRCATLSTSRVEYTLRIFLESNLLYSLILGLCAQSCNVWDGGRQGCLQLWQSVEETILQDRTSLWSGRLSSVLVLCFSYFVEAQWNSLKSINQLVNRDLGKLSVNLTPWKTALGAGNFSAHRGLPCSPQELVEIAIHVEFNPRRIKKNLSNLRYLLSTKMLWKSHLNYPGHNFVHKLLTNLP